MVAGKVCNARDNWLDGDGCARFAEGRGGCSGGGSPLGVMMMMVMMVVVMPGRWFGGSSGSTKEACR